MLEALNETAGPVGDIEAARLMLPVNPFKLITASVELPEEPAGIVKLLGLTVIAKSGGGAGLTVMVTLATWDDGPLVPETVTT